MKFVAANTKRDRLLPTMVGRVAPRAPPKRKQTRSHSIFPARRARSDAPYLS